MTIQRMNIVNYYECEHCGYEWDSVWDCEVDEDCPECGCVMTPCLSEEYEEEVI